MTASVVSPNTKIDWNLDAAERRSNRRYPLDLGVRFRSPAGGFTGVGRTVNLSSGGVLVDCQHATDQIGAGAQIEISIEWPLTLDGGVPLQLVAVCRVRRLGPSVFAAAFLRHQFRTLKARYPLARN